MSQVITFYSYSGGVGTSMVLADTAVLLTRWGYRTLMVDWDLEKPGLERFLDGCTVSEHIEAKHGIIDLLSAYTSDGCKALESNGSFEDSHPKLPTNKWQEMVVRFHLPGTNGHGGDNRLELLTAGRRDEKSDYVER